MFRGSGLRVCRHMHSQSKCRHKVLGGSWVVKSWVGAYEAKNNRVENTMKSEMETVINRDGV